MMVVSEAINKVIAIAKAEIGYLEKRSNASIDDKTANAGSNNYTKYWRDIKPDYQGQPWCACFVTWCFVQAFGQAMATKLLKHYPYVYCPAMARLFALYTKPKKGDIVLFFRSGTYAHTGFVEEVNGSYITTIEGNTSGGSTIIANGGGVCRKSYNINNLPGTKFCRPDYESIESEELSMAQYDELKKAIETVSEENAELKKEIAYYKNRKTSGRQKHNAKWTSIYNDFVAGYESGMSLIEIAKRNDVSERTIYRYAR